MRRPKYGKDLTKRNLREISEQEDHKSAESGKELLEIGRGPSEGPSGTQTSAEDILPLKEIKQRMEAQKKVQAQPPLELVMRARRNDLNQEERAHLDSLLEGTRGGRQKSDFIPRKSFHIYRCPIQGCINPFNARAGLLINPNGIRKHVTCHVTRDHHDLNREIHLKVEIRYGRVQHYTLAPPTPLEIRKRYTRSDASRLILDAHESDTDPEKADEQPERTRHQDPDENIDLRKAGEDGISPRGTETEVMATSNRVGAPIPTNDLQEVRPIEQLKRQGNTEDKPGNEEPSREEKHGDEPSNTGKTVPIQDRLTPSSLSLSLSEATMSPLDQGNAEEGESDKKVAPKLLPEKGKHGTGDPPHTGKREYKSSSRAEVTVAPDIAHQALLGAYASQDNEEAQQDSQLLSADELRRNLLREPWEGKQCPFNHPMASQCAIDPATLTLSPPCAGLQMESRVHASTRIANFPTISPTYTNEPDALPSNQPQDDKNHIQFLNVGSDGEDEETEDPGPQPMDDDMMDQDSELESTLSSRPVRLVR